VKNPAFNTVEEVESYLNSIPKFSTKGISAANFNLDRMKAFCDLMGNPENTFPSIHVAGTNGKGTTCQMLASVYQSAGFNTALYTSPHLIHVKERFKVNGNEIDDASLLEFFTLFGESVKDAELTFFELTTAIAFWYFKKAEVDIAVIETGLGGRLDATNVINPIVSIITSIGMDHADVLGNSLELIAGEKAGIIKNGRPVIAGILPDVGMEVVKRKAEAEGSKLYRASECMPFFENGNIVLNTPESVIMLKASSRKKVDAVNTAMAWLCVYAVHDQFDVSADQFKQGIEQMDELYPNHAHFEKLLPDREWYFDGAHNAEAVKILTDELLSRASAEKWTVVLSFMKDKLNRDVALLWNQFPSILIYTQDSERSARDEEMKQFFPHARVINSDYWTGKIDLEQSKSELVIFSGSFYFYEKVRRWMGTMVAQ
jgi:dihydrofolate synthase / folylpolyglutamate synthase